ncbi:MAG: type II secretion system GspH family protein [Planctomycetaceae bacterium]|nr:type II secretion system GspH family protein [Planctomycetaceae bacterium]
MRKFGKQSGFTLVELIVVLTALFAVMGVSVVLLVQTINFQRTNSAYLDGVRVLDRLVVDFRNDVHAYGKPVIPNDGNTLLQWKSDTVSLDYIVKEGRFADEQQIVRTLKKDGETILETYRLPEKTTVWCVNGADSDAGLVALSLWTIPLGTKMPPQAELNPFDRTLSTPETLESNMVPRYAGNWRTIIARYNQE